MTKKELYDEQVRKLVAEATYALILAGEVVDVQKLETAAHDYLLFKALRG